MVEFVPYETEYIGNYYSDEVLSEMEKKQVTEVSEDTENNGFSNSIEDDQHKAF